MCACVHVCVAVCSSHIYLDSPKVDHMVRFLSRAVLLVLALGWFPLDSPLTLSDGVRE